MVVTRTLLAQTSLRMTSEKAATAALEAEYTAEPGISACTTVEEILISVPWLSLRAGRASRVRLVRAKTLVSSITRRSSSWLVSCSPPPGQSGIVDQTMQRAAPVQSLLDGGLDLLCIADVTAQWQQAIRPGLQGSLHLLEPLNATGQRDHAGTCIQQCGDGGGTDTGRGPGDHDDLILQRLCHCCYSRMSRVGSAGGKALENNS